MTIASIEYKEHELRAYSHQEFALHRDPYAKGPRQFSSVVRIGAIQPNEATARRYAMSFATAHPTTAIDAIDLAMQYGKDIVDGKVQANKL
ncbi:hypothetical protein AWB81_04845 [Caballeronia arationis]|jgi:hypothetical protein|uniref:Uncharacterized protein n=1 Tax=Caballeronia arationis TaxID=1777142 RepID=A0A7Z7N0Y5_9BURK|nr:hypothetical protein [Caballeronia arationis]SAK90719.1 hypothetical protein AWB81_04845 [Caballeronia arationis]SOE55890.1 hypothetical protein SAMN05446927_1112 [Caballeronia arationis]